MLHKYIIFHIFIIKIHQCCRLLFLLIDYKIIYCVPPIVNLRLPLPVPERKSICRNIVFSFRTNGWRPFRHFSQIFIYIWLFVGNSNSLASPSAPILIFIYHHQSLLFFYSHELQYK